MSAARIFIDFGSTFTKVVAFDLDREILAARVQAPSTADTDVMIGLRQALDKLSESVPVTDSDVKKALACSSAAGGLRMVCIGLVPEYTTEAGRLAALGAGAKVTGTYSYELSRSEIRSLESDCPDIVLLTGGTDGGNKKTIIHNARMLAEAGEGVRNIIVAGNKSAHDDIHEVFDRSGKNIIYTSNVMPEFGKLDLEPVNKMIRTMFITRITEAKGISRVRSLIGEVLMPTPSAVLQAATILADGTYTEPGLGELLVVDVGGATTDVYSIATGAPLKPGVGYIGLPEPYAKRTVEGDLGLFYNLDTLAEIAGQEHIELAGGESREAIIAGLRKVYSVPEGDEQTQNQTTLSRLAVKTAVNRHVGRLEMRATSSGEIWIQRGKDLSGVKTVLGAGGPLAFSANPRFVLEGAVLGSDSPSILKPRNPKFFIDSRYILFAVGLLSLNDPEKAIRIFNKYIKELP